MMIISNQINKVKNKKTPTSIHCRPHSSKTAKNHPHQTIHPQ